ncbi:MAG: sle [Frankiales bacterium]|nr:sle [Frankiales bacterium]
MSDELSWYLEPPESAAGRPVPPGPPYRSPTTRTDTLAIVAASTGAFPLLPPLGIVLGAVAIRRLRRSHRRGLGLAQAGLIGGIVWSVAIVAAAGFLLWRQHELAAARDAAGRLVDAGRVPTSDVRAGDCLPGEMPAAGASWVDVTPCAARHSGEVYDVRALPAGDYPGEAAVRAAATTECAGAWQVGLDATTRAKAAAARGSLTVLVPTRSGWSAGDRGIACIVATDARTGALAGP